MKKGIYSKDLGIDLKSGREEEIFKWFLACLLFGKPIQQEVAKRTYFEFEKAGILSPEKILEAGWDKLVKVLDRGHYVRYDFSTATKLLEICKELKEKYGRHPPATRGAQTKVWEGGGRVGVPPSAGPLNNLLKQAKNKKDLTKKLQEFKGIGPTTTRIFLRDLRKIKSILPE